METAAETYDRRSQILDTAAEKGGIDSLEVIYIFPVPSPCPPFDLETLSIFLTSTT